MYQKNSHELSIKTIIDATKIKTTGKISTGTEILSSDSSIPADAPVQIVITSTSGSEIEIPEFINTSMFTLFLKYLLMKSVRI
ncbi:MAG: hypothetical protein Q7T80_06275 [Methanoregula sp.]|nr:hypothetical protein [Methanoregula sp.]